MMEFKIQRDDLLKELNVSKKYLSKMVPALGNFLFQADDATQTLTVTASDTQNRLVAVLPATVIVKGEWILASQLLLGALKNFPSDEVSFVFDAATNLVKVKCKKKEIKVPTSNSSSFIPAPPFQEDMILDLKSEELKALVSSTAFAKLNKPQTQTDYKFEGVHIKVSQGKATFICSDKNRVAIGRHIFGAAVDTEILVSAQSLKDFSEGLEDGEKVEIKINSQNQVAILTCGVKTLYPASFREKYPDVARYLPTPTSSITVNRIELISSLEIASLVHPFVDMEADKTLNITNKGQGTGAYEEILAGTITNPAKISLSCRTLLDGLKAMSEDEVELLIENERRPVIVRPVQQKDYAYLVHPVIA